MSIPNILVTLQTMKKVFFPLFKSFKCIANKCPMNCCALRAPFFEWEADMFDTKPEWQDVDGNKHNIKEFLHKEDGCWICNTDERNFCVFCNGDEMCSLQLRYGESAMPSVCRTFPRIITRFPDRVEYSLDSCCPVVNCSLKNWTIGGFLTEDDSGCSNTADAGYKDREKVMDCFADPHISLADCFRTIALTYNSERTVAIPCLTRSREDFLRKICAFHFYSYVLAYEGYPGIDNVGDVLLEFYSEYVPTLPECPDDWEAMSRHFAAGLSAFVRRIGFDLEIEDRHCDSSDFIP